MNQSERIQQLAAFPQTNPNPVMAFAADGVMTYSNDAAQKLAASLDADSPSGILPQDIKTIVAECLLTGENVTNLQTVVRKRTISWSFIPVPEGQVVHCYANDITNRLNLEAQLRYSVKMEAVGQLAAGVAHDFNNILTIIQGHADLLLQGPDSREEKAKAVSSIASAAERAGKLIKQLLVFSRKQVMRQRALQLNEVAQNLVPMLRGLLGDTVNLQFIPAPNLPPLSADLGMLEQVLVNLVLNARDAMPRGGRLTITTSQQTLEPVATVLNPEARPGEFVCLSVADTGCGMTQTTLGHLFEPFFTTKEPGKGTGLGLATVYGIVKQHQGWIIVDSQLDAGSTFTIFLPPAPKPAAPAAPQPAATSARESMPRGNETILVVEDEPALRDLVVSILQICGYRTYEAETGVAALRVWEQHKAEIDLLLTDMVMPEGVSGRQLAEKLQADDPSLKVIYTSGYSPGMAGKDIALLEGFNFLAKPYPPSRLALVVRECLDGKRPSAAKSKDV
ncbi:MAG TPA: ATP-binding protein [Verrucomicrobiae bacterium]|jgi:signal transduction histidine kinase/ActR/RegA family two-component response regulator